MKSTTQKTSLIKNSIGSSPIFLEMPHSGQHGLYDNNSIPEIQRKNLRTSKAVHKTLNFGCDIAVPTMTNFKSFETSKTVNTLRNSFARALTDPNRSINDLSGLAVINHDPKKHNSGLLIAQTVPMEIDFSTPEKMETEARNQFEPIYQKPFTKEEFSEILSHIYTPYHTEIKDHHERINATHGFNLHLSLHSLPAVHVGMVDGGYVLGEKAQKGELNLTKGILPDIILIHNNFQAADQEIVKVIRNTFENDNLIVSDGTGPFIGSNGVTGIYGNPNQGTNVIGIEHVTHDIEPLRHIGKLSVNLKEAQKMQKIYAKLIQNLLQKF